MIGRYMSIKFEAAGTNIIEYFEDEPAKFWWRVKF